MFKDDRRLGIFTCQVEVIEYEKDIMANTIFKNCIVLRAEYMAAYDHIEYMVHSSDFDVIPEGEIIPNYLCIIHRKSSDDGLVVTITREWSRIK